MKQTGQVHQYQFEGENLDSLDEPTQEEMVKYLLGELSEAETDSFEERYFINDEVFDQLLMVKAELIDRYLHGQLGERQTLAFENFFLQSPNHRREVALVRALFDSPRSSPSPQSAVELQQISRMKKLFGPWPLGACVAAGTLAVLLIAGSIWLARDNWRLHSELNTLRVEQQSTLERELELRERLATLQSQFPATTQSPVPATTPTVNDAPPPRKNSDTATVFAILTPGLTRNSGPTNQVQLQTETEILKLRLLLERDFGYRSYAVALKTSGGRTIQTHSGLRASSEAVESEFSADKLAPGDYIATLSGLNAKDRQDELADYAFRIVRQ